MPQFEHEGWTLAYEDRGDGAPVLLIHGLLMDHTMFDPQVEALSDRYRFVTPDFRAHGGSEHRAEEYTQWDMMEDQVALLDHLDIDRAVWGGVSAGGFQSLRAALRHPERVAGLILIDTQAGPEEPNRAPLYEASAQVGAADGWNEDLLGKATLFMLGASAGDDLKRHWIERWMAQPTFDAVEAMHAVTRRDDITERLGEIDAPAIVIHGEEDVAIEMEKAEALADGLPNLVEMVQIPGAGHSSTVENPDAVTAAIERFLQKVLPA
ncbi:MAG: alpha/beta hydrolase [Actinomycetota bacterium]|nr:alpha/beta hydrolase [Actinomycetota bacterium]